MKITRQEKQIFIDDIMRKIPQVNYKELAEKVADKAAFDAAPQKVKDIWNDSTCTPYLRGTGSHFSCLGWINYKGYELTESGRKEVNLIDEMACEQSQNIINAREMLVSAIMPITTYEKLKEMFPEFASLLKPVTKTANLPAITGVMDNLKSLGVVIPIESDPALA